MKIIFPELTTDPIAKETVKTFPDIDFVPAASLDQAAKLLQQGAADSMISGLSYSSRDVLLAYKSHIPLKSKFFSSCFICERINPTTHQKEHLALADGGINKSPTPDQFLCIIEDTATTFINYYQEKPRIAILSYSTYGSGGKNPDLDKFHFAIDSIRKNHPDWLIDGEMQLDAAINPAVAAKKTPSSPLKGDANVLIVPDLNSGNILYKSLERFGGFTIAGPIIQGFALPLADLSRGSTVADTILTINVIKKLHERSSS